jgi:hypothetical protein
MNNISSSSLLIQHTTNIQRLDGVVTIATMLVPRRYRVRVSAGIRQLLLLQSIQNGSWAQLASHSMDIGSDLRRDKAVGACGWLAYFHLVKHGCSPVSNPRVWCHDVYRDNFTYSFYETFTCFRLKSSIIRPTQENLLKYLNYSAVVFVVWDPIWLTLVVTMQNL